MGPSCAHGSLRCLAAYLGARLNYTGAVIPRVADIVATYRARRVERQVALDAKERAHVWFARARLAIVGAAGLIVVVGGLRALPWVLLPLALFLGAAIAHGQLLNARDRARSAVAFFDRGLARMADAWIGHGRPGDGFVPEDHPFAADLDLFGRGSLFELLATTRTQAGEETLARWLLQPASPQVAIERQAAVRELSERLDLREAAAVLGDQLRVGVDASLLRAWAASPVRLHGRATRLGIALLAASSVATLIWLLKTGSGGLVWIALLGAEAAVALWFRPRVSAVVAAIDEPAHDLELLVGLLRTIERESFSSPHLQALQARVGAPGHQASREIAALAQLEAMLASRHNVFFALPAALMLWATQWAFAIEAWRQRSGRHVPSWLDAVGEFEALLALGTLAAEHPNYTFPEFVTSPSTLEASDLAHPLLAGDAVPNSITLRRTGVRLAIVSGSNMSGKSTFLRAIGVNVVLAGMGAPVRASSFRLSPLAVGATIRVLDSLAEGQSRFFAEIRRLKQIVDLTRAHDGAVLFLLDEIFAGTNSHDRRIGAEALLVGLAHAGAIGLATTHDLALGAIANRLGAEAVNVHFDDQFENGRLTFDYKLKPGLVQTSNALELMRSVGLDVKID